MQQMAQQTSDEQAEPGGVQLQLLVRDHPGVLPQVCGLLMRRRFRYQALAYRTEQGRGRLAVTLAPGQRLDQVVKQLQKLYDVQAVEVHDAPAATM